MKVFTGVGTPVYVISVEAEDLLTRRKWLRVSRGTGLTNGLVPTILKCPAGCEAI
jgi:hypothetical protein